MVEIFCMGRVSFGVVGFIYNGGYCLVEVINGGFDFGVDVE